MAESRVFDKIRIGLASPEEVHRWSYGEVKKPETINYRTFKPERDGLFCERIFGPTKDWECHCGRYKKVKFKGIVCDRCGVEVTRSKVRRERMGHIELAAPVSHIWYLKGVPSPMALLLDMSPRPLEKVIYFGSYIVTGVNKRLILDEWPQIEKAVRDEMEDRRNAPPPPPPALASVTMSLEPGEDIESLVGRIVTEDIKDPETGETILESGDVVTQEDVETLSGAGFTELNVESDEPEPSLVPAPRTLDDIAGDDLESGLELLQKVEKKQLLVEDEFRRLDRIVQVLVSRMGRNYEGLVRAGLGAAAVRELLSEIDLEALKRELETEISQTQGPRRLRSVKRLEIVRAFVESKSRPEWMILDVVPVIPPELRPMVQLDGGRFATSDLNDLYRRIINRNNRLKKIQEIRAPESIINHEKRLLQEAVDALIDNGRRTRPVVGSNNRPLRSLSDMLKGKEGRFRKNLLGKRVDYSGRSVIVVGPSLKLHQCGLPKEMALELFKPFVMKALVDRNITTNIKTAKRLIDRVRPEVWDALEDVIRDHPVMLNRAPTLHRLGIQAFEPVLVDGKAIRVHPLVCAAFGADFDGDQMAVHVPLSSMAQAEGQCLMLATRNLFKPSDGAPIVAPQQDIVLGLYYMDQAVEGKLGTGLIFSSIDEAILAFQDGKVHLHAPIKVRDYDPDHLLELFLQANPEATEAEQNRLDPYAPEFAEIAARARRRLFSVTPGRIILASIFPYMMRYSSKRNAAKGRKGVIEQELEMNKKQISELIRNCYEDYAAQRTIALLDDLKSTGFHYAMRSALSISITDMDEPEERDHIINDAEQRVTEINRRYRRGAITAGERESQVLEAWTGASAKVADAILNTIGHENPLFMMTNSGARGSKTQITQLSGMRGLMSDPFGGIIEELPIKSNFHRGLNILEYFVSTHGQRKGLADTALRTADAGYLTRRLVDVAQDVIVRHDDCGTVRGIYVSEIREAGTTVEPLHDRIRGRVLLDDVLDPKTGEVILAANEEISDQMASVIEKAGVTRVGLRSPLTCESRQGICVKCYGRDMATQKTVEVGTAVGIIAAQSIGEPGTQLTMRTFHTGGVAGKNIVGVANVKQKKQEALKELHLDIERGHVSLDEGGVQGSERERSRAVQAMLKVLEEQVGGLLRVVELVEGRKPKGQAIITEVDGKVVDIEQKGSRRVIIHSNFRMDSGESPNGKTLGEPVRRPGFVKPAAIEIVDPSTGEVLAEDWDGTHDVVSPTTGEVVQKAKKKTSKAKEAVAAGDILLEAGTEINEKAARVLRDNNIEAITVRHSHLVPYRGALEVDVNEEVRAGDRLTEGPLDPDRVLELQGITGVQDYMVKEIQSVYKSQGVDINDKHIEVIVRQMLKKRKIIDPGETFFLPGQVVDKFEFEDANTLVREKGGTEATAEWLLLGITEASLATESFLSAASFQKTTKVLADAAVRGKKDNLVGLKENVIIGRLIPAGTGMEVYHDMMVGGEEGRNILRPTIPSRDIEGIDEVVQALREQSGEGAEPILSAAPGEEMSGFTEENAEPPTEPATEYE